MSRRILSKTSLDVLSCLRRQGSPYRLSPGNLLKATMVTSGTMTNRIDRLEESGLVRRSPDPDDKRGVRVSLTDKGLERRSEEHTSELQSPVHLVCRLLLEKKKKP